MKDTLNAQCRLLPHFIQAGQESPSRSAIVLGELPLPNQSTLQILLETLHRLMTTPCKSVIMEHCDIVACHPLTMARCLDVQVQL